MPTIPIRLIPRRHGEEHDLYKASVRERPVRDAAHDVEAVSDDGHALGVAIVDEACDVFPRHLGELTLEEAFEPCEDDHLFRVAVVVDDFEADEAFAFFDYGRFLGWWTRLYTTK